MYLGNHLRVRHRDYGTCGLEDDKLSSSGSKLISGEDAVGRVGEQLVDAALQAWADRYCRFQYISLNRRSQIYIQGEME